MKLQSIHASRFFHISTMIVIKSVIFSLVFFCNFWSILQHYKFNMSCESDVGVHYSSESIEFSTLHLSSRNRLSNPSQSPDYLMMNSHLKSLPAISNSIQDQQQDLPKSIKVVSTNLSNSRSYYTRRTSPHAVLGKQHFHLMHTCLFVQFLLEENPPLISK